MTFKGFNETHFESKPKETELHVYIEDSLISPIIKEPTNFDDDEKTYEFEDFYNLPTENSFDFQDYVMKELEDDENKNSEDYYVTGTTNSVHVNDPLKYYN